MFDLFWVFLPVNITFLFIICLFLILQAFPGKPINKNPPSKLHEEKKTPVKPADKPAALVKPADKPAAPAKAATKPGALAKNTQNKPAAAKAPVAEAKPVEKPAYEAKPEEPAPEKLGKLFSLRILSHILLLRDKSHSQTK